MVNHDDLVDVVRGAPGQVPKHETTQWSSAWLVLLGQRRGKNGQIDSTVGILVCRRSCVLGNSYPFLVFCASPI